MPIKFEKDFYKIGSERLLGRAGSPRYILSPGEFIVNAADDPAAKKTNHSCVKKADKTTDNCHRIAWEILPQKSKMCSRMRTTLNHKEDGCEKQSNTAKQTYNNARHDRVQANRESLDCFLFFLKYLFHFFSVAQGRSPMVARSARRFIESKNKCATAFRSQAKQYPIRNPLNAP